MNTALLRSTVGTKSSDVVVSEYVKTYARLSIPEMLLMDAQIMEETNNLSNLSAVLSHLIDSTPDEENKALLGRVRNNFDFFKAIHQTQS